MKDGAPRIFDRKLVRLRRKRAAGVPDSDMLGREASREIVERLSEIKRDFRSALVIGSREIADALDTLGMNVVRGDLVSTRGVSIVLDEEMLPFARGAFDLIVSALSLHAVNDLPGALVQVRNCLKPDGLFLGALYGGETLRELRNVLSAVEIEMRGGASPRVSPFADVRDLGQLLQRAGFVMPVADLDKHRLHYAGALDLMRDLRAMGETSALSERSRKPMTRNMALRAAELYRQKYGAQDGRILATFEIIYLAGWAPRA